MYTAAADTTANAITSAQNTAAIARQRKTQLQKKRREELRRSSSAILSSYKSDAERSAAYRDSQRISISRFIASSVSVGDTSMAVSESVDDLSSFDGHDDQAGFDADESQLQDHDAEVFHPIGHGYETEKLRTSSKARQYLPEQDDDAASVSSRVSSSESERQVEVASDEFDEEVSEYSEREDEYLEVTLVFYFCCCF
jgi:hypothetical protein